MADDLELSFPFRRRYRRRHWIKTSEKNPNIRNKWTNIYADNIDGAAGEIIAFLEEDTRKGTSGNNNVIFLGGWRWGGGGDDDDDEILGVGASAVLKEVAKLLSGAPSSSSSSPPEKQKLGLGLDSVIHVDCSLWESKRALQKAIAQQLELELPPSSVMAAFEERDVEDDLDGVEMGARGAIPLVTQAIMDHLWSRKFLVIFHNGSGAYIDLLECGVPVIGAANKRVLWTSRGRFRFTPREQEAVIALAGPSKVIMRAVLSVPWSSEFRRSLCDAEAEEVARYTGVGTSLQRIVLGCLRYVMPGISYATHAANYWVCSGIIQRPPNSHDDADAAAAADADPFDDDDDDAADADPFDDDDDAAADAHADAADDDDAAAAAAADADDDDDADADCGWSAWEIAHALQTNMSSDCWDEDSNDDRKFKKVCHLARRTSFFWTADDEAWVMLLRQHSSPGMLRVICLSRCTFSFASPPFLHCSNLRFLLLDRCKDHDDDHSSASASASAATSSTSTSTNNNTATSINNGACFQKLWVLDLSYTNWYWLLSPEALGLMAELRELNVKGVEHWSISHLLLMTSANDSDQRLAAGLLNKIVKLRVTADPPTGAISSSSSFPDLSRCSTLNTIILDGCLELEQISPDALPPSLESFSFSSSSDAATKIESISFRGCTRLKSVFLTGQFERLLDLDMSGTSIQTLDLRQMHEWCPRRIFLLGCDKLRAILWPKRFGGSEDRKKLLEILHIDTAKSAGYGTGDTTVAGSSSSQSNGGFRWSWYVSLRDARLLRSLSRMYDYRFYRQYKCIEITGAGCYSEELGSIHEEIISRKKKKKKKKSSRPSAGNKQQHQLYADVGLFMDDRQVQAAANSSIYYEWMWPCPPPPPPPPPPRDDGSISLYLSLLPAEETMEKQQTSPLPPLPDAICQEAATLHVHDSLSITSITADSDEARRWKSLEWCRVERCPNIEGPVFTTPPPVGAGIFRCLETLWASQLQKARCILESDKLNQNIYYSFRDLRLLHLDCCPRLMHVHPIWDYSDACGRLETLEIVCCGDLKEVFPLLHRDGEYVYLYPRREFPNLRHIRLHDLPSLQRICGHRPMLAPSLQTLTIRGCWALKRLPAPIGVYNRSSTATNDDKPKPMVDCEKEWWDALQWDGMDAGHHPSLYRTTHSRYYKNALPRVSVLR